MDDKTSQNKQTPPKNHRSPDAEALLLLQKVVTDELGEDERQRFLERFGNESDWSDRLAKELISDHLLNEVYERPRLLDAAETSSEIPGVWTDILDTDTLARLAAESQPLPKQESVDSLLSCRYDNIKPYDRNAVRPLIPWRLSVPLFLFLFGMIVYFEWNSETGHEWNEFAGEKCGLAVMTDQADVVWSENSMQPKLGDPLFAGTIEFDSGTIELLLFNGVRCVIEGPADLILLSEKRVFCRHGTWSVTVPPQGTGFEIQTPSLVVRDLGTEFLAVVDANKSEVQVLKGLVEVENTDSPKTVLETGQGALFRMNRPVEIGLAKLDRFISRSEMRRRSNDFLERSTKTRSSYAETPREAIRKIDFTQTVPNDANLYGGQLINGSRPGSKAFHFSGTNDRIRLRRAGNVEALTFVVSLRVDRLSREINPILMTEGTTHGGLVWHVLPDGQFIIGSRYQNARKRGVFRTPIVLTPENLGRWVTLAWTLQGSDGRFTVYADGAPVYSGFLPYSPKLNLDAIDIGSWKLKSGGGDKQHRLDGAVESVLLFDRVLTLEEIRALSADGTSDDRIGT